MHQISNKFQTLPTGQVGTNIQMFKTVFNIDISVIGIYL